TAAAIAGGGPAMTRPGDVALAHRGVLFLEDAPEFGRDVLAVLRQPLADGTIAVARSGRVVRFPARCTLVAGMTPCPCGGRAGCACTPVQKRRYRARLNDVLGSYLSIQLSLSPPGPGAPALGDRAGGIDVSAPARVAGARDRARRRFRDTPWEVNADVPGGELRRSFALPAEAISAVSRAVDLGEISRRAADQVIKVAWTLADLDGRDRPGPVDCGQALAFYLGVAR
ncbi:MAG: ATP-binding protein, partial [Streptosporangiaceae bacterium]